LIDERYCVVPVAVLPYPFWNAWLRRQKRFRNELVLFSSPMELAFRRQIIRLIKIGTGFPLVRAEITDSPDP
jgi:hypothetical protein